MDHAEGLPGLAARLNRGTRGSARSPVRDVFARALRAASLLEEEPAFAGRIRFRKDESRFRIYDRLLAPNRESTYRAVAPELEALVEEIYQAEVRLEPKTNSKEPFTIEIRVHSRKAGV